ncbi:MAG TPA: HDOD domain-containing protein [Candidatus Cloacimonadota bacterium]|nr:HDOD domain-containing protein [Candidatus Cloacimonadota bacterium]HOQ79640.1 HDOD domain-containing protein [Candidatus Cloacimonadota bacterium]
MHKQMILDRLNNIQEVPTLLTIAAEVERLTQSQDSSAESISRVIKLDPALTGKVLKIANSAMYAGTQRIISLQQAISRLGYAEIRRITLTIAFLNSFKSVYVDYQRFWIHSITTAFLATNLEKLTGREVSSDRLFTCGILHDIGVLIFDQYFSELYKKVFTLSSSKQYQLEYVEDKALGINHAEVGAFLLKKWKLPEQIIDVIEYHHHPQDAKVSVHDAKIIYLANFISNNRGIDNGTGYFPEGFYDDIFAELNLNIDAMPDLIAQVESEVEKAMQILKFGGK